MITLPATTRDQANGAGHTLRHLEEGGDLIHQAEELVQQVDAICVEDRTLSEIVRWYWMVPGLGQSLE